MPILRRFTTTLLPASFALGTLLVIALCMLGVA